MIMAKDIARKLKEHDPRIDKFIEEELQERFINEGPSITVDISVFDWYFNHSLIKAKIVREFEKRGFIIRYEFDGRITGACWFVISIPQE